MRVRPFVSLALLPLVALMTGCGITSQQDEIGIDVPNVGFSGVAHGGQMPITGGTVAVYAVGTTGYGSAAKFLAQTTTDSSGSFSFSSGAYTCPQDNTPIYIFIIGGNTGTGLNNSSVIGAPLGGCTAARSKNLVINEVTTVSLAFSMAQFFTTTLGAGSFTGATPSDSFGAYSSTKKGLIRYGRGISMADGSTSNVLVDNDYGGANGTGSQNGVNYIVEYSKINTIANILSACVNSTGATSATETTTPCGKLFGYTKNGHNPRPSDTLQAAVQIALNPANNVNNIYNLAPTNPPFPGELAARPNDFSIGVSYSVPSMGLAVPTGAISTLDIDASQDVWFTSNVTGNVGLAYFNPYSVGFYGPYNQTLMVNPTQVAIDNTGFAWANDYGSSVVSAYNAFYPSSLYTSYSLPGTTTTAITVNDDDSINLGLYNGTSSSVAAISTDRTKYAVVAGSTVSALRITSMAGDSVGGDAVSVTDTTNTAFTGYYVSPSPVSVTPVVTGNAFAGQIIFSGNDFLTLQQAQGSGESSVCIYSDQTCYPTSTNTGQNLKGFVIDGSSTLWIAQPGLSAIAPVPVTTASNSGGEVYLNNNSVFPTGSNLIHGTNNGGTITTPAGVGVDSAGNVWATNSGCITTGCTPGAIVISEIVGTASPTITPVATNITGSSVTTGTKPQN